MANTNQSTTSLADCISKLNTFLGANGWTTHHNAGAGEFAARITGSGFDVAMAAQWDTGTPEYLGIYQHLGAYNNGVAPYQQADDSGNGAASTTNATLSGQRHAQIGATPVQFWAVTDGTSYFYVVVQRDTDDFVSFGAGLSTKYNDWTGGEFVFGHRQDLTTSGAGSVTIGTNTQLLDGRLVDTGGFANAEEHAATMHIEDMDDSHASGLYAVCMGNQNSANLGNDRQGTPRPRIHVLGGYGAGAFARAFSKFRGTLGRALNPLWPIIQMHWNRSTGHVRMLGEMPGVRGCNIRDFAAGDEIVEGSDTWILFPASRKATSDTQSGTGYSHYQGFAILKVP